jgi:hypothetical protein
MMWDARRDADRQSGEDGVPDGSLSDGVLSEAPASASARPAAAAPGLLRLIRALAEDDRVGAIGLAEHAVERHVTGFPKADQAIALDILLRDLACLQGFAPHLTGFISRVEGHIDRLHRGLARGRRERRESRAATP